MDVLDIIRRQMCALWKKIRKRKKKVTARPSEEIMVQNRPSLRKELLEITKEIRK